MIEEILLGVFIAGMFSLSIYLMEWASVSQGKKEDMGLRDIIHATSNAELSMRLSDKKTSSSVTLDIRTDAQRDMEFLSSTYAAFEEGLRTYPSDFTITLPHTGLVLPISRVLEFLSYEPQKKEGTPTCTPSLSLETSLPTSSSPRSTASTPSPSSPPELTHSDRQRSSSTRSSLPPAGFSSDADDIHEIRAHGSAQPLRWVAGGHTFASLEEADDYLLSLDISELPLAIQRQWEY